MKKKLPLLLILCALFLGAALFFFFKESHAKEDITGYVPDLSTEYVVTQYADASGAQGTFYTIENDDYFLIIDGGWAENESAVRKVIAEHGNVVDAWIISHPHRDHAGAFNAIYANPGDIVIREIYDNGFDYDFIESVGEPLRRHHGHGDLPRPHCKCHEYHASVTGRGLNHLRSDLYHPKRLRRYGTLQRR